MQNARELWVPRLCLVQRNPGSGRVWRPSGYAAPMEAAPQRRYRTSALKSHFGNRSHSGRGVGLRRNIARVGGESCWAYNDGGAAGSRTANSVRPGREVTSTVPPWASTIDWTMDKPRPLVPSEVGA